MQKRLLPQSTLDFFTLGDALGQQSINVVVTLRKRGECGGKFLQFDGTFDAGESYKWLIPTEIGLAKEKFTRQLFSQTDLIIPSGTANQEPVARGKLVQLFALLHPIMSKDAYVPSSRAVNMQQALRAARTDTTLMAKCLHALSTGRPTTSNVPVNDKAWFLPW